MHRQHSGFIAAAIGAAALFGVSAPIAKALLGRVEPVPLAALMYLGSGLILLLFKVVSRLWTTEQTDAPLTSTDVPWLIGAVLAGGVAAPIVLMFGLRITPASTAALLLNFEGVATSLIAVMLFGESVGRRIWYAIIAITIGSILLSWQGDGRWGLSLGAVAVITACVLWGFDNNFTRNISGKDPIAIVAVKGICAGSVSLLIAITIGSKLPSLGDSLMAMAFGSVSYGLSIVLFIIAMRGLGAARTSAYFGTAPFVGAIVAYMIFRNAPSVMLLMSLPLMVVGAMLLLSEEHIHRHTHLPTEHEHRHRHDDGHHGHSDRRSGWHSHRHTHEAMEHEHHHAPDEHHRHEHDGGLQEE